MQNIDNIRLPNKLKGILSKLAADRGEIDTSRPQIYTLNLVCSDVFSRLPHSVGYCADCGVGRRLSIILDTF